MIIEEVKEQDQLILKIKGRLDTTTAPQLEQATGEKLTGLQKLVLDFTALEYISSAGLRVLFLAQKIMNRQGKMVVRGANENVMEVFEITGSVDIMTIEKG